ncbi:MAG: cadherin-like beta sandwich domain-containing protein [Angelakisella sp.]
MKYSWPKRTLSGLLAALLLAAYPSSVLVSMAADAYYIKFIADDPTATTIIEGSTIKTTTSLPEGHIFQSPPFLIAVGGTPVAAGLFDIRDSKEVRQYEVQAMPGAAYGTKTPPGVPDPAKLAPLDPRNKSLTTYSMDASMSASLNNGKGIALLKPDPDPLKPGGIEKPVSFDVVSASKLAITVNSAMTFKVTSDETGISGLVFSPVEPGAKGNFSELAGKTVSIKEAPKVTGGKTTFTIEIGGYSFAISMSTPDKIFTGSSFTIEYDLQKLNPLILKVATPQLAVDEVRDSIQASILGDANATNGQNPYIKLAKGDYFAGITTGFSLLSKSEKYNNMMTVEWVWDGPATVLNIENKGQVLSPVSISPAENDTKGILRAKVTYQLPTKFTVPAGYLDGGTTIARVESATYDVPITILGTGKLPAILPQQQTIGQNPPAYLTGKELPGIMDVYTDDVDEAIYPFTPTHPYKMTATLTLGEGRGRADEVAIRSAGTPQDAVNLYVENSTNAYVFGTKIKNPSTVTGQLGLEIAAKRAGHTELIFDFYYKGVLSDRHLTVPITVQDNTPSDFKQLSKLELQSDGLIDAAIPELAQLYPGGVFDFQFSPTTYTYGTINLPNHAAILNITPDIIRTAGMRNQIDYTISGGNLGSIPASGTLDLTSNDPAKRSIRGVPLFVGPARAVTLTATAQNGKPQIYMLNLNLMPPSTDSSLKGLSAIDLAKNEYLTKFLPSTVTYSFEVPYKTRWIKLTGKANHPWAKQVLTVADPTLAPKPDGSSGWVPVKHPVDPDSNFNGKKPSTATIEVTAEDATAKKTQYTISISRKDPSTNAQVGVMEVQTGAGKPMPFDGNVLFNKDTKQYELHIPYSATQLRLLAKPEDLLAEQVTVQVENTPAITQSYTAKGEALRFDLNTLPVPTVDKFSITVTATAESGKVTDPPYTIYVIRNDPDRDNALTGLSLKDQEGKDITSFVFNPQKMDYTISVPFRVEKVCVLPTPRSPLARLLLIDLDTHTIVELKDTKPSETYELKTGVAKNLRLEIQPEDLTGEVRVYTLSITRQPASSDARLKSLVADGGEALTPKFSIDRDRYTVNMPAGSTALTFTAVPMVANSTMLINGEAAESGKPSKPIELLSGKTTVTIEVTAENGRDTEQYTVEVTDLSKIPKGNNADLSSITISYGRMDPGFRPGVTEYDVAVLPEVSAIEIIPTASDPEATFEVFADSKKLGDYYNKYTSAIRDGDNVFTIKVTAEDGKTMKSYTLTVYRNDEDKQGAFKPITSAMVDFAQTNDPIVVDISKYAIVTAELFNTLKTKYPEKSILFQGNDYSLQIKGKDIAKLVPHDQLFDLSISFTAPDEDKIWNILSSEPRNDKVDPVFIHFNHHGVLPGPMLFTISLGRQYRNESATWNYFNEERDRIDFYGGVRTNSRGTFTVRLDHMSTYLLSEYPIINAENKVGDANAVGDHTGAVGLVPNTNGSKPNPNTGLHSGVNE